MRLWKLGKRANECDKSEAPFSKTSRNIEIYREGEELRKKMVLSWFSLEPDKVAREHMEEGGWMFMTGAANVSTHMMPYPPMTGNQSFAESYLIGDGFGGLERRSGNFSSFDSLLNVGRREM